MPSRKPLIPLRPWRRRAAMLLAVAVAAGTGAALAGPVAERIKASGVVRVCIWPNYYGVTWRNPNSGQLSGIDIELSEEFARNIGARLEYVDSSFPALIDDLLTERCDVAMHAVGILPARMEKLRFSRPYLQSDIYGVTTRSNRAVRSWADIDKPGIRVAVQSGTAMEPVMTAALKQARIVVVKPPQTREGELESGRVDVFMTDYPYSRRLLDNAEWARLISPPTPFHVIPYAYAVKPGDDEWLARVDDFVARIKRNGRLLAAAQHNGLTDIVVRD
jgi:ABC-type amino acid transport substrate-binding protein